MMQILSRAIAGLFAAGALCLSAPSFAQTAAPYALEQLDPEVRRVVERARDSQRLALMAAARSYSGAEGVTQFTGTGGDSYQGDCAPCGDAPQRHGYGLMTWPDGELYAGEHVRSANGGAKQGYGVYIFTHGGVYEGGYLNDKYDGYGVYWDAQGRLQHQGLWRDGQPVE